MAMNRKWPAFMENLLLPGAAEIGVLFFYLITVAAFNPHKMRKWTLRGAKLGFIIRGLGF